MMMFTEVPNIYWKKYNGFRVEKPGWRALIGYDISYDSVYAYIIPAQGKFIARVDNPEISETTEFEVGTYKTLKEAKVAVNKFIKNKLSTVGKK